MLLLLLGSCKEKAITPVANFSFDLVDQEVKKYVPGFPVGESLKFTNQSTDGVSYLWSFGDGSTSTAKEPIFAYTKSGTYTISLTTTSSTGTQNTVSQPIILTDRLLKQITINTLGWNALGNLPAWEGNKRADLTIEVGIHARNSVPTTISTVLYRAVIANATNTMTSFNVPVTQRVVLDPDVVLGDDTYLMINLYGNDGTGNQLVYSTGGSGLGWRAYFSTDTRLYTIYTAFFGTGVTLGCGYQ